MGWRDILDADRESTSSAPQKAQNTQKTAPSSYSANKAYYADESEAQRESKLLEALARACAAHDLLPIDLQGAMSSSDIAAFARGDMCDGMLAAFARALVERRMLDKGLLPDSYTERSFCSGCGPVWLWLRGNVIGCPWCKNRSNEAPIPRPASVQCGDCQNFLRTDHKFLGHCAVDQPEAPAGLVSSDERYCERFLPASWFFEKNFY